MTLTSSKKERTVKFLLWCSVVIILSVWIGYLLDFFNFVEEKNFDFDTHDPSNLSQFYDGTILLKSKSFTEYSDIDIEVNVKLVAGVKYPILYAVFPLSHNVPTQHGDFGTSRGGGWIPLEEITPGIYRGFGTIEYQNAGNYWFAVTDRLPRNMEHSEKADNNIEIRERGSDTPSIGERIMVSIGLLGFAAGIIGGRAKILGTLMPPKNKEAQETSKSNNPQNNSSKVNRKRSYR